VKAKKLLLSNTSPQPKVRNETERYKTRQGILEQTKPKRDAFVLAHKAIFLPLLPENNYIDKLEGQSADSGNKGVHLVKYNPLDQQPVHIKATMKAYQLEGLSFLVYMYRNGMSAILGDEMGLGKTLQTLALFQWLADNETTSGETRPHLVVCPLSVLSSWINEASKWVPSLHVIRFHGPKAERERLKQEISATTSLKKSQDKYGVHGRVDVVVTTYETFKTENIWFKRAFAWRYCVLDEGHKIKNEKTGISSALQSLRAEFRLLLTGTPLQNNLKEMWALLHWLLPEVFPENTQDLFKQAFDLSRGKVSTTFMDDARRLLELIMLRRMKSSPSVNLGLPPKTEVLLYVPLTPMQRFWYTRMLTKADNLLLDELFRDAKSKELESAKCESEGDKELALLEKGATAADLLEIADDADAWAESRRIMEQAINANGDQEKTTEWKKLMNLMRQLQKTCNHPYLMPYAAPEPYYLGDHVKTASGKFIVLDKLVEELVIKQKKKILIFSQFTRTLDICEDLLALRGADARGGDFRYLRFDGQTARAVRNLGIRLFNDPQSDFQIMLISTRAGGLGVNLASASDVIFLDEDWNPQVTLQAEARAHRIGQKNPVTVYKLCTQGTIEEQMQGRIRKKLYLSAKITESMRNIYYAESMQEVAGRKRKRGSADLGDTGSSLSSQDEPPLGTSQLKSLLRKGAQTLARPEVDVTAMLTWTFDEIIARCKDGAEDPHIGSAADGADAQVAEADERAWLATMEKVETAIFEGKRHHKALDDRALQKQQQQQMMELHRANRRLNKNTTVEINGFAVSKDSLLCADWEAVPTLAGKDPRLAEPVREKRAPMPHQDICQHCRNGEDRMVLCANCPRAYHLTCLAPRFRARARMQQFFCPQHECASCGAKTTEAGGLIFRCRGCVGGWCEDCFDFEAGRLVGDSVPELERLGVVGGLTGAWWVECAGCVARRRREEEEEEEEGSSPN